MRVQCPSCNATSGEIQYNQVVSRTVTMHLDASMADGIGNVTAEIFKSETPTDVQCSKCGHKGTAEEFGLKTETAKEQLFIMIGALFNDGIPTAYGSVRASSPEKAIEKSLDPKTAAMYVPTHMHNQDEYGELPDREVKAIAQRETLHYFNLDGEDQKRYSGEFTMLEVDLETGSITEH